VCLALLKQGAGRVGHEKKDRSTWGDPGGGRGASTSVRGCHQSHKKALTLAKRKNNSTVAGVMIIKEGLKMHEHGVVGGKE